MGCKQSVEVLDGVKEVLHVRRHDGVIDNEEGGRKEIES
jgi:hypothetical protein